MCYADSSDEIRRFVVYQGGETLAFHHFAKQNKRQAANIKQHNARSVRWLRCYHTYQVAKPLVLFTFQNVPLRQCFGGSIDPDIQKAFQ